MKPAALQAGAVLRFKGNVSRLGATDGEVAQIEMVTGDDAKPGIETPAGAAGSKFTACTLTCSLTRITGDRMLVSVPRNEYTRKTSLAFKLAADCKVSITSDDYRRAGRDDEIVSLTGIRLSTGEQIIRDLRIRLTGDSGGPAAGGHHGVGPHHRADVFAHHRIGDRQ